MDYYIYAILIILFLWVLYKQYAPVKGLRNLNAEQFKKEYKGQQLIDVREVHEYKQGHIAGAVNIPLGQIPGKLASIPKEKPVFLYCRSGMHSKQAGKILSKNGYRNIAHLNGGIMGWKDSLTK